MDDTNKKGINHFVISFDGPTKAEIDKRKEPPSREDQEYLRKKVEGQPVADIETLRSEQEIANLKANRELRDKYSFKAFKVVKKSLWGWAILLFIYGLVKLLTRHENGGFEIFSDHVLIAITTATTLNIYAGFLSLIRGLFPSIKEYSKKK